MAIFSFPGMAGCMDGGGLWKQQPLDTPGAIWSPRARSHISVVINGHEREREQHPSILVSSSDRLLAPEATKKRDKKAYTQHQKTGESGIGIRLDKFPRWKRWLCFLISYGLGSPETETDPLSPSTYEVSPHVR